MVCWLMICSIDFDIFIKTHSNLIIYRILIYKNKISQVTIIRILKNKIKNLYNHTDLLIKQICRQKSGSAQFEKPQKMNNMELLNMLNSSGDFFMPA